MTLQEANAIRKKCLEILFPVPRVEYVDTDSNEVRLCFTHNIKFLNKRNAVMVLQAVINEQESGNISSNNNIGENLSDNHE